MDNVNFMRNPTEINIWWIIEKESMSLIWRKSLKRPVVLIEGVTLKVSSSYYWIEVLEFDYNTKKSMNVIWGRSPKKLGVWIEEEVLLEVELMSK